MTSIIMFRLCLVFWFINKLRKKFIWIGIGLNWKSGKSVLLNAGNCENDNINWTGWIKMISELFEVLNYGFYSFSLDCWIFRCALFVHVQFEAFDDRDNLLQLPFLRLQDLLIAHQEPGEFGCICKVCTVHFSVGGLSSWVFPQLLKLAQKCQQFVSQLDDVFDWVKVKNEIVARLISTVVDVLPEAVAEIWPLLFRYFYKDRGSLE